MPTHRETKGEVTYLQNLTFIGSICVYFAANASNLQHISTHIANFTALFFPKIFYKSQQIFVTDASLMIVTPQERILTLKKQSSQITSQAQQEKENFQREKNNLLVMLQKVMKKNNLCLKSSETFPFN